MKRTYISEAGKTDLSRDLTIPKLFIEQARRYGPKRVALREKDRGIWRPMTWEEYYLQVKHISLGLVELGLKKDDKVAMIGDNRPEGLWAELGTLCAGGVSVWLFQDCLMDEVQYIVDHCDARFLVCEGQEEADKGLAIRDQCPKLERIIWDDPKGMRHYQEPIRVKVAKARLVANPGCYPTGALMGLVPIADLVEGTVFVDSKSGTSGAGRSAATNQLFAEVTENLRPYSVWKHRHQPEIQEKLSLAGGRARVLFAPQLLPIARGLLSACYFATSAGAEIGRRLDAAYRSEPFVRVLPRGTWPEPRNVRGTNLVEIGWQLDDDGKSAVVMTAIDNLGKGAAGQAVQNFNCMVGLDERTGLIAMPALP